MATAAGRDQGKTAFVRQHLGRDSGASEATINEAWRAAGNQGAISGSLVSKTRSKLGKTAREKAAGGAAKGASPGVRGGAKAKRTSEPAGRPTPPANGRGAASGTGVRSGSARTGVHERVLDEVEDGIDDLIFKLKGIGGGAELPGALRKARRLLIRSHES